MCMWQPDPPRAGDVDLNDDFDGVDDDDGNDDVDGNDDGAH